LANELFETHVIDSIELRFPVNRGDLYSNVISIEPALTLFLNY